MTDKAQDAAGLALFKDGNAVRRKTGVFDVLVFWWYDYIYQRAGNACLRAAGHKMQGKEYSVRFETRAAKSSYNAYLSLRLIQTL